MAARRDQTLQIGPRSIRVVDASITALDERVDALVSSDDNHLTHGGGVSKARVEAALDEARRGWQAWQDTSAVVVASPDLVIGGRHGRE